MDEVTKKLLDEIDVLSEYDRDNYQVIDMALVEYVSEKAAMINGEWLPKSTLRTDMEGNIFLANWKYAQIF